MLEILFPLNSMSVTQTAQLYLEQTKLVHLHLTLLGYFLIYNNIFQIVDQSSFLLLGYALIFWWMCSKITLYSLRAQPGFCLIFILKKTRGFQSETLLNASLISFNGRTCSRYSKISKNNKNTLKNAGFKGNSKYKEVVCFTGYNIHYSNSLNNEVQK